jgi:predicted RNA binding protein YcfA (HicA-like mRNA interferase family)
MSPRLRALSARELLKALAAVGFEVVSTRGSHAKLRRRSPNGPPETMTVPLHKELAPGTLRALARQAARYLSAESVRTIFFKD